MSPPVSRRRLLLVWTAVAVLLACAAPPTAVARPANGSDPAAEPAAPGGPYDELGGSDPAYEDEMMADMPAADDAMPTSLVVDSRDEGTTKLPDASSSDSEMVNNRNRPAESENAEGKYVDSPTPDKELRIKSIKNQMLSIMGWTVRNPSPVPTVKTQSNVSALIPSVQQVDAMRAFYDKVKTYPTGYTSDAFTEKTQSFYPICEMPKNMNEEIWNSKESMNLMFNISMPRSSYGVSVNVSSARLRLYKQFVSCYSQTSDETDDTPQTNCLPTFSEDGVKRPANSSWSSLSSSSAEYQSPSSLDDRQIRVSVYVRSLKKKKVKRRLLDSRMIPYYGEKWTEWNIHRAVKSWRSLVRSFALSIEVEDEYGNFLPVNRFFKPMNCTGDAQMTTPKPIPGFLMEAMHFGLPVNGIEAPSNMSAAQALSLNMYRYPIVDVTTVEGPEPEDAAFRQAKDTFVQRLTDAMQQTAVDGAQADRETSSGEHHNYHVHRIRHGGGGGGVGGGSFGGGGNRHKINSTDIQSAVAKLARDNQLQQQKQQQAAAAHTTGSAAADAADGDTANASTDIPD